MSHQIFSFFSGLGFLDLGFESGGFHVAYANELHSPFLEAYRFARRALSIPEPAYGYHAASIADFLTEPGRQRLSDLVSTARHASQSLGFIGGPPCPDFSVGGKNRGREGDNGILSHSYIEMICQQLPDYSSLRMLRDSGARSGIRHSTAS